MAEILAGITTRFVLQLPTLIIVVAAMAATSSLHFTPVVATSIGVATGLITAAVVAIAVELWLWLDNE